MLRILGSPKKLCSGWSRREMLCVSGLGLLGFPEILSANPAQASKRPNASGFGKAKSCILLYLYGAASQLETFDPKPDAPVEIRGELKSIRSNVPGMDVCELLPNVARVMDRVTLIRSLSHPYPIHGVAFALTGRPTMELPMELNPHDSRHWPFIGSVVDFLSHKKHDDSLGNLALPFPFSSQRVGEVARAGPYASFLGASHNPTYTNFRGQATRSVIKTLQDQKTDVADPYLGITPESRFEIASATSLPSDITLDRLNKRLSLAQQFDRARFDLEATPAWRAANHNRQKALGLINSPKVREALDLDKESMKLRESYGMTLFGQAALTARRLVEAGSRFVSVFWDEYGLAGSAWDTHWDHYPRMKNELLPGLDKALSGLLHDLDARGLLDETLVLCLSEHGRTPKIDNVKGGGRDHWSRCYSAVMAGGGVKRGFVLGKSDKIAGAVAERPVSPKDVLATTYHLLGIDPETTLTDRTSRPIPVVAEGKVLTEIIA
jgi:hypothetical protein